MPKYILAFVGENENDALAVNCADFLRATTPPGLDWRVINVFDKEWTKQLGDAVNAGIAFAWGCAGIGCDVSIVDKKTGSKRNMWDTLRVPFISVLADQPAHVPRNHRVPARFVVNGYVFRDFLDLQRRLIKSPQVSTLIPHVITQNPHRDRTPWSKRAHRMVFVKSGGDPEAYRAPWARYPKRLRAIIEDSAAAVLARPTGDISDVVFAAFRSHDLEVGERHDIFFSALQDVDLYTRLVRGTQMAQALCRIAADIFGARWDHIDKSDANARFHPAISAASLGDLFADAQYVVSTTPNFATGTHERIPFGFSAKACVISDDNDFTRKSFAGLQSYFGFDWTDPDWAEKLVERFADPRPFDDAVQPAAEYADREFDPMKRMRAMLEITELMLHGENLGHFTYEQL